MAREMLGFHQGQMEVDVAHRGDSRSRRCIENYRRLPVCHPSSYGTEHRSIEVHPGEVGVASHEVLRQYQMVFVVT